MELMIICYFVFTYRKDNSLVLIYHFCMIVSHPKKSKLFLYNFQLGQETRTSFMVQFLFPCHVHVIVLILCITIFQIFQIQVFHKLTFENPKFSTIQPGYFRVSSKFSTTNHDFLLLVIVVINLYACGNFWL
jgi:hypothetical protein